MTEIMRYIEGELLPMLRERKSAQEAKARRQLAQWKGEAGVCSLLLSVGNIPNVRPLPAYDLEEIHYDNEKMFISQLAGAISTAFADGDAVPSVRANVGCGCVNTLIGGLKQNFFPDKMPWLLEHLTADALREITADAIADSPEFTAGLEQMRYMKQLLEGTGIEVYPMDIQGPIDMAHLWLGNDFFYEVYDDPELVHHALSLAVDCIDYAFRKNWEIIRPKDYICHYNALVLPVETPLKLSEDTSTLICAEHISEYMVPYLAELFRRFGGGYIHYCGDNRHLLAATETMPGSIGLNFGNPERHDFTQVLPALAENGKCYVMTNPTEERYAAAARPDGAFNIFFTQSCDWSEQTRVLDEHAAMIEKYRR